MHTYWNFWTSGVFLGIFKINSKPIAMILKLIVTSRKPNSCQTKSDICYSTQPRNHKITLYLYFSPYSNLWATSSYSYSYINNTKYWLKISYSVSLKNRWYSTRNHALCFFSHKLNHLHIHISKIMQLER